MFLFRITIADYFLRFRFPSLADAQP